MRTMSDPGVDASSDEDGHLLDPLADDAQQQLTRREKREAARKRYPDPNPLPEPLRAWREHLRSIWLNEDGAVHSGIK